MDLTVFSTLASSLATIAIPVVLGGGVTWARAWMTQRGHSTDVFDAATRAAGAGYAYLVSHNLKVNDPVSIASAVEAGMRYLAASQTLPAKMDALGLDDNRMGDIVHAELGKLLAADPATSVGDSATKTQVVNNVVAAVEGIAVEGLVGEAKKLESNTGG